MQDSEERDVSGHKGKHAEEKTATFGTTSQISPHIESDPKHETPFFGISFYLEAFLFIWNKNTYPYITALIECKLNICIHTSVKMSF